MNCERADSSLCSRRGLLLASVIACLCFSAGEGLRLLPFPVHDLSAFSSVDHFVKRASAIEAPPSEVFSSKGDNPPCTVQKRLERVEFQHAQSSIEIIPPSPFPAPVNRTPISFLASSLLLICKCTGRSPPVRA